LVIIIASSLSYLIIQKTRRKNSNSQKLAPRNIQFQPLKQGHDLRTQTFSRISESFESITPIINQSNNPHHLFTKENVPGIDPRCAYFIRNLLTPEECKIIIEASEETGFETRKFEGGNHDSASCVVWSPQLTNAIFERMGELSFYERTYYDSGLGIVLDDIDFENQIIQYHGLIDCINPSVRVERYYGGQHLKIHRDGCVLVNGKEKTFTVYAIIVYLNDDYEEGYTRFSKSKNPKDLKDLYEFIDVKGKRGDALVFRHEILHAGGNVKNGAKYILRLDAAYRLEEELGNQSSI